jgi:ATP-dependent RNA helicase DDX3X
MTTEIGSQEKREDGFRSLNSGGTAAPVGTLGGYINPRATRFHPYVTSRTTGIRAYPTERQRFPTGGLMRARDDQPYHRKEETEENLFKSHINTGINFEKYDQIPVETFGDNVPQPVQSFQDSHLPPSLLKNISMAGYEKPTPVQKYSIPIVGMAQRDLMACAQTGSGKTGAFLFPVISRLLKEEKLNPKQTNTGVIAYPSVLVLAPTRELATQIYDEARKFIYRTGLRAVVVYGGADIRWQLRQLEMSPCDILVATPGRLVDIYDRGNISLECVKFLILDEADRMLDMGFEHQIRYIVEKSSMPGTDVRSTLMFSATFPQEIQKLAADFLKKDYIFLTVGRVGSTTENITQQFEFCEELQKRELLLKYLKDRGQQLSLIFTKTKLDVDELESYLKNNGVNAIGIHGDRSQRQREYALNNFKSGQCSVLVATDVAARGLDIPNVGQVINYDLPENIDDYVHRIGRTGRAGNKGLAISFFTPKNNQIAQELIKLLKDAHQNIPQQLLQGAEQERQKKSMKFNRYRSRNFGGHPFSGGRGGYSSGRDRFGGNRGGFYRPRSEFDGSRSGFDGSRSDYSLSRFESK